MEYIFSKRRMPKKSNGQSPKDFAEHLRTVHFALIATCLALVVIVMSPSPETIRKANDQLKEISEAVRYWSWGWQKNAISKKLQKQYQYSSCNIPPFRQIVFENGGSAYVSEFKAENWILSRDLEPEDHHPPKNLEEFRRVWDADSVALCPSEISGEIDFSDNRPSGTRKNFPLSHATVSSDIKSFPNSEGVQLELRLLDQNTPVFHGERQDSDPDSHTPVLYEFDVPVSKTTTETAPLRDEIIDSFPAYHWMHTNFKSAFEDLDRGTTGFQDLDFSHLTTILELQANNSKDTLEAFGIKFPRGLTTRWGVLLILGIQLYLWAHLAEYNKRMFQKSDIAWVGSYNSLIPRCIFIGTALLAPVGVVSFLCFYKNGLVSTVFLNTILSCIVIGLTLLLAAVGGIEYAKRQAAD